MKVWLVSQEGPGAGPSYLLDPSEGTQLSVGRSSGCHIVLKDERATRHHADIRWDGRQWTVVDKGSTNGTYVNGMRVHGPYDLRVGDRVTVGETTMVLHRISDWPPTPPPGLRPVRDQARPARKREGTGEMKAFRVPAPPPQQRRAVAAPRGDRRSPAPILDSYGRSPAWATAAYWVVQGLIAAAVVFLASGAFLPWVEIRGSLSQELGPMIQTLTDMISVISGSDSQFEFTQVILGLDGYGKLTLGVAVISLCILVADIIFTWRSAAPGLVYLLSALLASGAMASDLINLYQLYEQAKSIGLLFGVRLEQVIQAFDYLVDMNVSLQTGVWLTVLGLALLLVGGLGRLVVALLNRNLNRLAR